MVNEMLGRFGMTFEQFLTKTYAVINKKCYCAEPELYGSYVTKYHPELYIFRTVNTFFDGKKQMNSTDVVWDEQTMREIAHQKKQGGFDLVAMHSWCE
jgi:hypothetical protein